MNEILDAALRYASVGLSVVPVHGMKDGQCDCGSKACGSPGKHPRGVWRNNTTTRLTDDQIRASCRRYPNGNIGIVTGEISDIVVLDVDGEEGIRSLEAKLGIKFEDMPVTPMVRTPRGGYHLYYRYTKNALVKTKAGVLPSVDIRANGGFVVAPPSTHKNGKQYEWVEGRSLFDVPIADFDFSLLYDKPKPAEKKKKEAEEEPWHRKIIGGVGEGQRNDAATRLAGRYFGAGLDLEEVSLMMSAWNERNSPPIPDKELETTIKSILEREESLPDGEVIEDSKKQEILAGISSVWKIPVLRIRKIASDTSDTTLIEFHFDGGKVCSITVKDIYSPKSLQAEVSSATNKVIPKLSKSSRPTHDQLVQRILSVAEITEAEDEATDLGETLIVVRDYISRMGVTPELVDPDGSPDHGSFRYEGQIWFEVSDMVRKSYQMGGIRISAKTIATRLKRLNLSRRVFNGRHCYGITYQMAGWKENHEFEYEEDRA